MVVGYVCLYNQFSGQSSWEEMNEGNFSEYNRKSWSRNEMKKSLDQLITNWILLADIYWTWFHNLQYFNLQK